MRVLTEESAAIGSLPREARSRSHALTLGLRRLFTLAARRAHSPICSIEKMSAKLPEFPSVSVNASAHRPRVPASPTAVDALSLRRSPSHPVLDLDETTANDEIESFLEDLLRRDRMRHRQRQYERRYRANKKHHNQRVRKLWLATELEMYDLLQKNAVAFASNAQNTSLQSRYLTLCVEEQAILRDTAMLGCAYRWSQAFDLRNYCTDECMQTRPQWAAIERQILEAASIRPFRLPHFRFEW